MCPVYGVKEMFDVLFKNICVVTPDEDNSVINNAFVGVKDGKVAYLSDKEPADGGKQIINGINKVLIPGFVNTHTHAAMSVLRGYADDHNLQDWLHNYVFPAEAKLDPRCVYTGTQLAIAEMIRTGTVSITDMYMYIPEVARAAYETGIYANITNAALVFDRDGYVMEKDNSYIQMEQLRKTGTMRMTEGSSLIRVYTRSIPALRECGKILRDMQNSTDSICTCICRRPNTSMTAAWKNTAKLPHRC